MRYLFYLAIPLTCIGLATLFSLAKQAPPTTRPALTPGLEIQPEQTSIRAGQREFKFKLKFSNPNDVPLTIVRPIDGCDVGWRFANYEWTATDSAGKALQKQAAFRCGNTNALVVEDFIQIPAGESVTLGSGFLMPPTIAFPMGEPGKVKLTLTYTCDPARPNDNGLPLGDPEDGTDVLRKRAWAGAVTSAEVELTVLAP